MRLSLAEPNNLRATAPNMPEFLSRPLRVVPPNQMHDRQSSPTHSNCGAFRAWQGATANAPMSGPAGCGEIGGGRTLVNRQWHADRRPLARNHALVNVWQPTIGCQSGPIERVSAAPPPRDACGANHQGYAYGFSDTFPS